MAGSIKIITKEQLINDCKVTDVTENSFTRVRTLRKNKVRAGITYPTVMLQKSESDPSLVAYMGLMVSLYNYTTKKYINMPFSKLRWIWEYGYCPDGVVIDHIDTNPFNNDLSNLRLFTNKQNSYNRKKWSKFRYSEVKGKTASEIKEMIKQKIKENK